MTILSTAEALTKRNELVGLGYTIIPNVMPKSLLEELRAWSDDVFKRVHVDPKYRYQGSDIHVYTEARWAEMDRQPDEKNFADPIVSKIIEQPRQQEICQQMQL